MLSLEVNLCAETDKQKEPLTSSSLHDGWDIFLRPTYSWIIAVYSSRCSTARRGSPM